MKNLTQVFHIISYLQYPILLASLWFYIPFVMSGINKNSDWPELNSALVLFGIAVSFTTLQDTKKTSLKFEKKIWKSPKKAMFFIIALAILIFSTLGFGIYGYFLASKESIKEVSFGVIVLGIGLIGMLKTAIEVFENHRTDKQTTVSTHKNQ